jgi:hypothetical protein
MPTGASETAVHAGRPRFPGLRADSDTKTLAWRKQGLRLVPTWMALQHRGSAAAVDADTLAIGDEAVAS